MYSDSEIKDVLKRNKRLPRVCDRRIKDGNKWLCGDSINKNLKYKIALPCVYDKTCPEIKRILREIND